jgi:hypothetical protein
VVVALIEAGLHGTTAALPVRDVIKAYFDKKSRTSPQQKLASLPVFDPRSVLPRLPKEAAPPTAFVARFGDQKAEEVKWP